jgi:hypothetical protein
MIRRDIWFLFRDNEPWRDLTLTKENDAVESQIAIE